MTGYDVKRELEQCYAPKNSDWALIDVPRQQFIAIDGVGDPNTSAEYARAVEALYAVAYTIKFASRRSGGRDFVVEQAKKALPTVAGIRHQTLHEGTSAQVLHVGSYDDEGPVLARLHQYLGANNLRRSGPHHEIYLSDRRRTDPAKLRTILRQPVQPAKDDEGRG